jgi:phage baseplate assembly protein W
MAKQKFLGLQYPLVKTPRGILAQKRGVDQIKADLLQLLLTNPGERVMLPTYGTPLRQLIFEPNDSTLTARARKMIVDSILAWEPRIVISDIEVSSSIDRQSLNEFDTYEEKEAILYIRIKFIDPENIQTVEELVLESPIGG